jgi:hypothetical protein
VKPESGIGDDDPVVLAKHLLKTFGRAGALQEAIREGLEAQAEQRLYDLSIWREVKCLLRMPCAEKAAGPHIG